MDSVNYAEEFDKVFSKYGGLLEVEKLVRPGMFNDRLERANKRIDELRAATPSLPPVHIGFIFNQSLNATATKSSAGYFIGINHGTFFLIQNVFARMLSSSKILREVGNPDVERDTQKIFNAQLNDFNHLMIASRPEENLRPNDHLRLIVANLLTNYAFQFLAMHEYAHITNGHVDFLGNTTSSFSWKEMNYDEKLTQTQGLFFQTCELDADCWATVRCVREEMHLCDIAHLLVDENVKALYTDRHLILKLLLFAIYTFFRLFNFQVCEGDELKSLSHPPAPLRQWLAFSTVCSLFDEDGDSKLMKTASELAAQAINEVEEAFNEISEQGIRTEAFEFAMSQEGQAHMTTIRANWKNVRPLLEPFATAKLARIQDDL